MDTQDADESSTDPAGLIGQKFDDRYEVVGYIGSGSVGHVYRARDHRLEYREVAVEVLRPGLSVDQVARFRREALLTGGLSSPHLVAVSDFSALPDGRPYLIMELLRGEALHVTLHRTPRIPLDRALRIADGLLAGLEAAHQAGVVHRDLKPENVFIVEEPGVRDHVKIVDFGFARVFQGPEALDVTGEAPLVIGTVAYMAPEQLRAKVVDHRADLYGAAAILFKMLAGRLPYETSPMGTAIVAAAQFRALQLDAPPARITDYASDLADEHMLEAVLLRALQPRADDRYTSAGEFRRALANAVGKRTMPPQASAPGVGADLWNQPASAQENARRDPTGTRPSAAEFPPPPATAAEKRRLALAFVAVGIIVSALVAFAMVRIARSG